MIYEVTKTERIPVKIETPAYRKCTPKYIVKITDDELIVAHSKADGGCEISVHTGELAKSILGHWFNEPEATEAEFTNLFHKVRAAQERFMSNAILVSPIKEDDTVLGMLAEAFKDDKKQESLEHEMNRRDMSEGEE
jgi:hypothetical protein